MKKESIILPLFKSTLIIYLMITALSIAFMFLFYFIPLQIGALVAFNFISIFISFAVGLGYLYKKIPVYNLNIPGFLFIILLEIIIFAILLFALTASWGSISFLAWGERILMAALGSMVGVFFAKKLCNFN